MTERVFRAIGVEGPVGDIVVHGYTFDPKDDITPFEIAKLVNLLPGNYTKKSFLKYLEEHNLRRHFKDA